VEVGGTFTDLVAADGERTIVRKVPSVREAPDRGVIDAIEAAGIDLSAVGEIIHGSTVATNAVLERKGGRIAFAVTAGFEDILYLQRQDRTRLYDLFYVKPEPVIRRGDVIPIAERIDARGGVETALDEAAAETALATRLGSGEFDGLAVCLLNAYANPAHERALRALVERLYPGLPVTISTDVSGEYREYERASTTALSAYVQPVISAYLTRLAGALAERGFRGRFEMMQSNGGRAPAEGIRRSAINALLSGPAAGVTGAIRQAGRSGWRNLMTLDIGGTSADVCLVTDGRADLAPETRIDNLPIQTPMIDISTVGAGGGSLIRFDDGGLLRVGPESAGADPGPACYGRGGTRATLTDAHVARGTVRAAARLSDGITLDAAAALAALEAAAAGSGMDVQALAEGAIRVANANIVGALRVLSTQRGKDPRDYVLVAYGGGGPLHAAELAEDLGMSTVIVPPYAGVISAYGLTVSDNLHFETRTHRIDMDEAAPDAVRAVFAEMAEAADRHFGALGLPPAALRSYTLDMRLRGQAFEIPADLDEPALAALDLADLKARFAAAHEAAYSFAVRGGKPAEIVSFRLAARLPTGADVLLRPGAGTAGGAAGGDEAGGIVFRGARVACRFLDRALLPAGQALPGCLVIEDGTSTTLVPPGWTAERDPADNLVLRRV